MWVRLWQVPSHGDSPEDALAIGVGGLGGPGPCRAHSPETNGRGRTRGAFPSTAGLPWAGLGWAAISLPCALLWHPRDGSRCPHRHGKGSGLFLPAQPEPPRAGQLGGTAVPLSLGP